MKLHRTKKRKIDPLFGWDKICLEYPQLPIVFGCGSFHIPSLSQINCLLFCFHARKEDDFESACNSLLELLRRQINPLQKLDTIDPSIIIYTPPPAPQDICYFDTVPNEILCMIFRYIVFMSTPRETKSCCLVSKRIYAIVRESINQMRDESAYTIKGFSIGHRGSPDDGSNDECVRQKSKIGKYIPPDFIKSIQSNADWGISMDSDVVSIGVEFIYEGDADYKYGVRNRSFTCEEIKRIFPLLTMNIHFDNHRHIGDLICYQEDITGKMDTIIYNCDQLVISHPITVFDTQHFINFHRVYKTRKGYFTVGDLIERVGEFYQTKFTLWEYNYFLEEVIAMSSRWFGGPPNTLDLIVELTNSARECLENDQESRVRLILHSIEQLKSLNGSNMDTLIYSMIRKTYKRDPNERLTLFKNRDLPKYKITQNCLIYGINIMDSTDGYTVCDIFDDFE